MSIVLYLIIGVGAFTIVVSLIVFLFKFVIGKTVVETKKNGVIVFKKNKKGKEIPGSKFSLFQRGEQKEITNVFKGKSLTNEVWEVFDYKYFSRDFNSGFKFKVVKTKIDFPDMTIHSEKCNHKIGDLFGYYDVRFENREDFLKDFSIRSRDTTATFRVLSEEFIDFIEEKIEGNLEIEDDEIIYYENEGTSLKELVLKMDMIIHWIRLYKESHY